MSDPASPERVIARLRPHGRALFWPTVALLLIVGATARFYGTLPADWENLSVLAIAGLAALLLWLVPVFRWLGRNYTITTRRIIVRRGSIVRVRQEALLSRCFDVTVRKTGLQSIFGSGDVAVGAGLDHPIVLTDVPRADLVQAALHDLIDANRSTPGQL